MSAEKGRDHSLIWVVGVAAAVACVVALSMSYRSPNIISIGEQINKAVEAAQAAAEKGDFAKGESLLGEAEVLAHRAGLNVQEAKILCMRGSMLMRIAQDRRDAEDAKLAAESKLVDPLLESCIPDDVLDKIEKIALSASKLDSTQVEAYYLAGQVHMERGELNKAVSCFCMALERNPSLAPVHNDLGYVYYLKSQFKEAKGEYEKALLIDTGFAPGHYNLAVLLLGMSQQTDGNDDKSAAKKHLEEYLRLVDNKAPLHKKATDMLRLISAGGDSAKGDGK